MRCEMPEVSGAPLDKIYGNKIRDMNKRKRKVRRRETTYAENNLCPLDIKHSGHAGPTDKAGDDGDYLSV